VAERSLLAAVERYYSDKFAEHGPTAQGVDWNSGESQELRFSQLLRVAGDDEQFSLVDYGCGYGALIPFLDGRGLSYVYRGFDLSKAMVEHARREFGRPPVREFTADEATLQPGDYALASGVFNVRLYLGDEQWLAYVLETLDRLNQLGTRGFAFNMLTSYSDPHRMRPDLYYSDPRFFFDHCKRSFSRDVALLHDYGLYEFTMIVRK
jgi:SAM-dependent methyltransferase